MGTVQKLAEKVKAGLQAAHPKLRKTVLNKRALAVGALLEAQTPNTSERERIAGADRAAGGRRAMAAAAVKESSLAESSDAGTVRPDGAERGGP